jgi:hypothetical protein
MSQQPVSAQDFQALVGRLRGERQPGLDDREALSLYQCCEQFRGLSRRQRPVDYSAVELMTLAGEAAEYAGDYERYANSMLWRAQSLRQQGDASGSRDLLEEALLVAEDRAPGMSPWLQMELGSLARQAGAFDGVLPQLELAEEGLDLVAYADQSHSSLRCFLFGERARFFQKIGNLDHAAYWLEREAQAASEVPEDLAVQQTVALHAVRFALARGAYERVLQEVDRSLDRQPELQFSPAHQAELQLHRADAAVRLAERQNSDLESTSQALEAAVDHPRLLPWIGLDPVLHLAWLRTQAGDLAEAERLLQRARTMASDLGAGSGRLAASFRRAFLDASAARLARERWAAASAADPTLPPLDEHLQSCEASFDTFLQVWSSTPLLQGGVGFLLYRDRTRVFSELLTLTLQVHPGPAGVEKAIEQILRVHSQGTLERSLRIEPGSLQSIQEGLQPLDVGLLVFVPGPDESHVFSIDHSSIEHHALPRWWQLRQRRDDLVAALLRAPTRAATGATTEASQRRLGRAVQQLSSLLLPLSLAERLAAHRAWTVVGDEHLGWMPWECLLPPGASLPLGMTHALSYAPSLGIRQHLSQGEPLTQPLVPDREPSALVLAAPEIADSVQQRWPALDAIELSDAFCRELAAGYGSNLQLHQGAGASAERLVGRLAEDFGLLQILTHGIEDRSRPRPAALLLSPGGGLQSGIFDCGSAEALTSPALVVLTACGSGKGPLRRGDATQAFGTAFFRAGARAVVVAPADLDRDATLAMMGPLHRALLAGHSTAEALRQARLHVARQPAFDHPYYYSLLRVLGLGHRPVFAGH